MPKQKLEEIEKSAREIVESFVEATKELPELEETYYSHEFYNVVRPDGEPSSEERRKEFRKLFVSVMPRADEKGSLRVEVAKWVK